MHVIAPCRSCGQPTPAEILDAAALAAFTASGVLCEACASADRLKERR